MNSLRIFISLIATSISLSTFAGGSGGGGVMMRVPQSLPDSAFNQKVNFSNKLNLNQKSEIILHLGQADGLVKFAYGKITNGQWQIKDLELPLNDLESDASVMKALTDSIDTQTWAEIK